MTANNELKWMWKEADMEQFDALLQHLSGTTVENRDKS
jgi:hypothetical protein